MRWEVRSPLHYLWLLWGRHRHHNWETMSYHGGLTRTSESRSLNQVRVSWNASLDLRIEHILLVRIKDASLRELIIRALNLTTYLILTQRIIGPVIIDIILMRYIVHILVVNLMFSAAETNWLALSVRSSIFSYHSCTATKSNN